MVEGFRFGQKYNIELTNSFLFLSCLGVERNYLRNFLVDGQALKVIGINICYSKPACPARWTDVLNNLVKPAVKFSGDWDVLIVFLLY